LCKSAIHIYPYWWGWGCCNPPMILRDREKQRDIRDRWEKKNKVLFSFSLSHVIDYYIIRLNSVQSHIPSLFFKVIILLRTSKNELRQGNDHFSNNIIHEDCIWESTKWYNSVVCDDIKFLSRALIICWWW
jgi:hypothetical protein